MAMNQELQQATLFDVAQDLPHGLVYQQDFLTRDEEQSLLGEIREVPLREARFREYFAKRRVAHFHGSEETPAYDDGGADSFSSGPLPPFLMNLRDKVARWIGVTPSSFVHALVSEYRPGTPIGWHRDKPVYGIVVGISLAGWGRMRFRPLDARSDRQAVVALDLAPRSAYVMRDVIRWQWQHSMLPTKALRYSVTFRTRA
jgi:alkylated DNA repair dioxygenase AlkB